MSGRDARYRLRFALLPAIATLAVASLHLSRAEARGEPDTALPFRAVQPELFAMPNSFSNAWGDYDNDGDLDLAVSLATGEVRLYRNDNGTLVSVGASLGMPQAGNQELRGLSWGDYDADGFVDLIGGATAKDKLTVVMHNEAGKRFVNVAAELGLTIPNRSSRQTNWVDYDNDGDLDVYATDRAGANALFRNDHGRFTQVFAGAGPSDDRPTVGACWFDFDRDGDLDVFLANQSGAHDALWRNDGDTFTDVAPALGLAGPPRATDQGGVGCAVGDYDNDGDFDLFVANYGRNQLYRNNGDGTFTDVAHSLGVGVENHAVSADWGDYDNDGDLDLFVASYTGASGAQQPADALFRNDGPAGFVNVLAKDSPINVADHGVQFVDFDHDGGLDLSVTDGYGPIGGHFLFRNTLADAAKQRSLSVLVLDAQGHHTRFGAEVRLFGGNGKLLASRLVPAGGGYNTQGAAPVHVGLARRQTVRVEVTFLTNKGRVTQDVRNVKPADYAGRSLVVRAPADSAWTPEQAFAVKRVGTVAISPDAHWAAVDVSQPVMDETHSEWRPSIRICRLDRTDCTVRTETPASAPAWSADGRYLLFASTRSGRRNVWRTTLDEGAQPEQLTQVSGGLGEFRLSPDGKRLAYVMVDPQSASDVRAAREKNDARVVDESRRFARLYVLDLATKTTRQLTPQDIQVGGHVGAGMSGAAFDWSPDGTRIAFSHSRSPLGDDWVTSDVSVVDVATGTVRPLAATPAAEGGVAWSPDGKWVAVTVSEIPATYALTFHVVLVSPSDGTVRTLADSYDQRPAIVGWTGDSRAVVISEARGTISRLSSLPTDGGAELGLSPDTLMVSAPTLNESGTHVGYVSESPTRAPEPFASPLASFAPQRVATLQAPPAHPLPKTEPTRWRSFDGREVEGLLTYPIGYREGSRVPLLVILHGGPPGGFTQTFVAGVSSYPIASFASAGFAVLRPNVRGSSGYGREFRFANMRDWGGGDYKDVMAGVDALIARGIADGDKLGVMGWSYGGYLTAFTITQTTRFRAASVGAGITNLVSYVGSADIPGFISSYFGGEFWDAPELWQARSAMFNVGKVTTPTLIQHGEADVRVPVSQGSELYVALKRRGVPAAMVVYPRQGHGVSEPKLQLDVMQRNLEWFERWVLPSRR